MGLYIQSCMSVTSVELLIATSPYSSDSWEYSYTRPPESTDIWSPYRTGTLVKVLGLTLLQPYSEKKTGMLVSANSSVSEL